MPPILLAVGSEGLDDRVRVLREPHAPVAGPRDAIRRLLHGGMQCLCGQRPVHEVHRLTRRRREPCPKGHRYWAHAPLSRNPWCRRGRRWSLPQRRYDRRTSHRRGCTNNRARSLRWPRALRGPPARRQSNRTGRRRRYGVLYGVLTSVSSGAATAIRPRPPFGERRCWRPSRHLLPRRHRKRQRRAGTRRRRRRQVCRERRRRRRPEQGRPDGTERHGVRHLT
mmetsp:Transcript_10903/g.30531  ORF Transcript_10903/g.30531 Transcript_10903/m.30531 type:complete len:224 (+) Transcript_10903:490-1161(+)